MINEVTFVKKVSHSSTGFVLWIPKDVTDYLSLDEKTFVEFSIKKIHEDISLTSMKRLAKSGNNLLLWIPKDISMSLHLNNTTAVEVKLKRLEYEKQ